MINGIIVLVPGSNGDGRGEVSDTIWQAFAQTHEFALLGCWYADYKRSDMFIERYVDVSMGSGQALIEIIKRFSISSGHLELEGICKAKSLAMFLNAGRFYILDISRNLILYYCIGPEDWLKGIGKD